MSMKQQNTTLLDNQYVANTYARFPLNIVRGQGAYAYDDNGKCYIDLGSGIAVNTLGYSDAGWVAAVTEQLQTLQHTSNLYYTNPCALLAEQLCLRTGMKKVFFSNSGAEANECAIKVARKYAADKKGADHYTIITLESSFHGRTLTTLAATGQEVFHKDFLPLTPGFVHVPPNDKDALAAALQQHKVAAIMLEPVQGEGGVCALDPDYVAFAAKLAAEQDVLLIADEVQTGNGRTGTLYAYMQYGFTPDILSTAKGLGGGLPLGATLLGDKVKGTLTPSSHGSTFGGNPVCCAGALHVLSRLDEAFLQSVRDKAAYVRQRLSACDGIFDVSGLGLMIGFCTKKDANAVVAACREQGVLVIKAKHKIRLLPPLNIEQDVLEKALDVIVAVCNESEV